MVGSYLYFVNLEDLKDIVKRQVLMYLILKNLNLKKEHDKIGFVISYGIKKMLIIYLAIEKNRNGLIIYDRNKS